MRLPTYDEWVLKAADYQAQRDRMREALAFYADLSLWEATDERGIVKGSGWRAREDGGAVARAALSATDLNEAS